MFPRHDVNPSTGNPDGTPGYVTTVCESDTGTITGKPTIRQIDISPEYRMRIGLDSTLFQDQFTSASNSISSKVWNQSLLTQTIVAANGFATLNNGGNTANGTYAILQTWRNFNYLTSFPLYGHVIASVNNGDATNKVAELGFGYVTAANAALDGCFFRWAADGKMYAVVNFNGTETTHLIGADNGKGQAASDSAVHYYIIEVFQNLATFWSDQVILATIPLPAGQAFLMRGFALPMVSRVYNTGVASAACKLNVAMVGVTLGDNGQGGRNWSHQCAGMGLNAAITQPGTAAGMNASIVNSTIPTAGAGSNTAALVTGLGGYFQLNAPAGAATDYIVTAFQNPQGSATLDGKILYITRCHISCINYGAVVATTPTTLQWQLAWGSTAVSLATADSVSAKGYVRRAIGSMYAPVGAVVGAPYSQELDMLFETPLVIYDGEWIASAVRVPVGTATASQTILGSVDFEGYFE